MLVWSCSIVTVCFTLKFLSVEQASCTCTLCIIHFMCTVSCTFPVMFVFCSHCCWDWSWVSKWGLVLLSGKSDKDWTISLIYCNNTAVNTCHENEFSSWDTAVRDSQVHLMHASRSLSSSRNVKLLAEATVCWCQCALTCCSHVQCQRAPVTHVIQKLQLCTRQDQRAGAFLEHNARQFRLS